ncbi:centrosomal protein of 97 kDa isoform X2 [Hemicordylus capensis]|nr:centrosomal protein of 97 kDa isoform X2 [Hemicordylus capensis]XP_053168624.1 centrosomal protein of 97 kDa isoform X2 [Hemicordylus capensis]
MMGVAKLIQLRVLNLPHNSIGYVEGLKDLACLEWLNLAGNNLKTIDQINICTSLQHLDLSDNNISQIGDISKLLSLKTLLLHGNIITSLRTAPACLPQGLAILSLAENEIRDLNEISFLSSFPELEQLSIMNNPCVMATPSIPGFDYRPYIVSWCLSLKVLDGYVISQKESLKAEWLYSQGKGRSFRPGQHIQLVQYLASVCPLTAMFGLQTAEDAKLEKILHKQRLHQRQLMYQSQADESPVPSNMNKGMPVTSEPNSPPYGPQIMTESEPVLKKNNWVGPKTNDDHSYAAKNIFPASVQAERDTCKDLYLEDIQTDEDKLNSSLLSSESTFMPVASGLSPVSPTTAELRLHGISIDVGGSDFEFIRENNNKEGEEKQEKLPMVLRECSIKSAEIVEIQKEDQEEGMLSNSNLPVAIITPLADSSSCQASSEDHALKTFEQHTHEDNLIKTVSPAKSLEDITADASVTLIQKKHEVEAMNRAATKLQARWRGFYTRNHHPRAKEVRYEIRLGRMQEHIMHLTKEVEKLKKEKDEERLQRLVQEEAVKFLWDQVRSIQEWQLSINPPLSTVWQHSIPTRSILSSSKLPVESSGLNQASSPVDCSIWLSSSADTCHQKYLPGFPDSGFHSCVTDQNCLNESQFSQEDLAEANENSLGNSLETVKLREYSSTGCPSDAEEVPLFYGECSKHSFSSEQDTSLLQQYLKSVEQLEEAGNKTSFRSETENSKSQTAISLESQNNSCNVLGSQNVLSSAEEGNGQAAERSNLNAEMAEEKQADSDSSFQALPVSITV